MPTYARSYAMPSGLKVAEASGGKATFLPNVFSWMRQGRSRPSCTTNAASAAP